ncbi:MAG: SH3 domain-containing protein [Candidatus Wallbacteria bacterium]
MKKNMKPKLFIYTILFMLFLITSSSAQINNITNTLKNETITSTASSGNKSSSAAGGVETGYVNVNTYLNVRSGPSTDNSIIGRLHMNDKVDILGSDNGWYKINYNGQTGWISGRYVTKSPATSESYSDKKSEGYVKVSSGYLNVRSAPNTNSSVLGHLSRNEKVNIIGSQNGWYKINYSGGTGWVCGYYISDSKLTDSPSTSGSSSGNNGSTQGIDPPATGSNILKVPIRTQFDSANVVNGTDYRGSWCGPTSFAMVMDYYGIHNSTYNCAKLVKYTFQERNGTPISGIVSGAKELGFSGTELKSGGSMDWLKSQVASGKPVIVNVDTKWQGHYIVVVGFEGDNVVVNDPGKGDTSRVRYTMSKETFWQCWSSKNRNAVVVQK